MRRHYPLTTQAFIALSTALACGSPAPAAAQGADPTTWAVTGVSAGKQLTVRAQPSPSGKPVGSVPRDARGLTNLECRDDTSKQAAQQRWCRIRYKGIEGWVSARFLKDSGPQATAAAPVPVPTPSEPVAAPPAPASPPTAVPPPAPPAATAAPAPAPTTAPKAPTGAGTLVFTCTAAGAIVVMVDKDGAITNQNYPPRDKMRLTISVKPSAPESAGPVATASVWQMLGQQGERFEGTLVWGKAVDAREGHWRLDLQNKTLRMVQPQEGIAARFFRFDCE